MNVKEIMETNVITMDPDVSVHEAAKKMVDEEMKFIIVTEKGKLVGIVAEKPTRHRDPIHNSESHGESL